MVRRERFDQALVTAAVGSGATFVDNVQLKTIVERDLVVLETTAGSIVARAVVGADGTNGRTGRYVGVTMGGVDLALEYELSDTANRWADDVYFDWGKPRGSYAWMFPKNGTITVGAIQAFGNSAETRRYLDDWLGQLGLSDRAVDHFSGHLTQWRTPDSALREGRVIVSGDAAGLLNPWTREGISFALHSGMLAGKAAAIGTDDALDYYCDDVRNGLGRQIESGERLLRFVEAHPRVLHLALGYTVVGAKYFMAKCRDTVGTGESPDRPRRPAASSHRNTT